MMPTYGEALALFRAKWDIKAMLHEKELVARCVELGAEEDKARHLIRACFLEGCGEGWHLRPRYYEPLAKLLDEFYEAEMAKQGELEAERLAALKESAQLFGLCACGCGRTLAGASRSTRRFATAACRQRYRRATAGTAQEAA